MAVKIRNCFVVLPLLAVIIGFSGCTAPIEIITATPDNIGVRALGASDATPVAEQHCSERGRSAVFVDSAPEGRTAYSTYFFACR